MLRITVCCLAAESRQIMTMNFTAIRMHQYRALYDYIIFHRGGMYWVILGGRFAAGIRLDHLPALAVTVRPALARKTMPQYPTFTIEAWTLQMDFQAAAYAC